MLFEIFIYKNDDANSFYILYAFMLKNSGNFILSLYIDMLFEILYIKVVFGILYSRFHFHLFFGFFSKSLIYEIAFFLKINF